MNSERFNPQYQELFKRVADLFLEECPNRMDGINLERVESFVHQKGLQLSPYRLGSFEDIETAAGKLPDEFKDFLLFWLETARTRENKACYWSSVGVSIVPRDRTQEAAGGAVQTEALLVHEAAGHGSSTSSTQIIHFDGVSSPMRTGFKVTPRKRSIEGYGSWLEEAFAARLQAEYKKFSAVEQRQSELSEVLDTEVTEESSVAFTFCGDGWSYPIILPGCYLDVEFLGYDVTHPKGLGVNQSHAAAVTLDLLIQNDPALEQLLVASRSKPVLLREIASRIEAFDKGLYGFLQRRTFPDEGLNFHECAVKYWRVVNLLYDGDLTRIFTGSSKLYGRLENVLANSKDRR